MKRVLSVLACFFLLLAIAPISNAAGDAYLRGSLGVGMFNDTDVTFDAGGTINFELDPGLALSGAIGGNISDEFRMEGEIAYQKNDLDKASVSGLGSAKVNGDVSALSILANGYYDFVNSSPITPFLTGGVGLAKVDVSRVTFPSTTYYLTGDDDVVLAYQLGAGLAWSLNEELSLDFNYRYFATQDPDFEIAEAECASHNFYVGVRTNF